MVLKKRSGPKEAVTLAIDIGGTGLKMMALDAEGKPLSERLRVPTPQPSTSREVLAALDALRQQMPAFHRVSVGFPGVIKHGCTLTSVNLGPTWTMFPLEEILAKSWKVPVRLCNDAAVQGYGAIQGKGVELMITLGTGFGSALFTDGKLCPGLELGHHPWRKQQTYEELLGKRASAKPGSKRWNKLVAAAIDQSLKLFNWDTLYIGGGNARKISLDLQPPVHLVSNEAGLLGGVALWKY